MTREEKRKELIEKINDVSVPTEEYNKSLNELRKLDQNMQQDRIEELGEVNRNIDVARSFYDRDTLNKRKKELEDEIEFYGTVKSPEETKPTERLDKIEPQKACEPYLKPGTDKPPIKKPIVIRRTFLAIAHEIAATLERKKIEYGDSFNSVEKLLFYLYPKGINPAQYPNLLSIIRISEKLFRLSHAPDTKDSFTDIAGYSILALLSKENKPKKENQQSA